MKIYQSQPTDSFESIAAKFGVKDENFLQAFHNLNCSENDIILGEIPAGASILIPEDPQFLAEDHLSEDSFIDEYEDDVLEDEGTDTMEENEPESQENTNSATEKEEEKKSESRSNSSQHDGKYFVIPKGMCQCDKGSKFPNLKVTSHQKHYWNDADGQADYLAVTEDDLQFNPPAVPFGNCSVKNGNPCAYAPAGKWTKTYDKVKVMGKSCVTEVSELMCSTGGKITIMKHGQQSEAGKSNVNNANPKEQQVYNPLVDFETFQEEINGDDPFEVE